MRILVFLLLATSGFAAPEPVAKIEATLDAWHLAASQAKEKEYFDFFAPEGVFLGTDPGERWPVAAFRKWAKPHFDKGKGWTLKAKSRHVFVSPEGTTAWFDEDVESKELGPVRGSGVLSRVGGQWKIAQYNLSVPIPNDRFDDYRKMLEAKGGH